MGDVGIEMVDVDADEIAGTQTYSMIGEALGPNANLRFGDGQACPPSYCRAFGVGKDRQRIVAIVEKAVCQGTIACARKTGHRVHSGNRCPVGRVVVLYEDHGGLPAGRRQARGLEGEDVLEAIDNTAAELDVRWPFMFPSPTLQGAMADVPTACQIYLVEVSRRPVRSFGIVRSDAEMEA